MTLLLASSPRRTCLPGLMYWADLVTSEMTVCFRFTFSSFFSLFAILGFITFLRSDVAFVIYHVFPSCLKLFFLFLSLTFLYSHFSSFRPRPSLTPFQSPLPPSFLRLHNSRRKHWPTGPRPRRCRCGCCIEPSQQRPIAIAVLPSKPSLSRQKQIFSLLTNITFSIFL